MKTDKATSFRMKKVGQKNTSIEKEVRMVLRGQGIKYSLRTNQLPGKPDIIIPKNKVAIFVHGCFWHGHKHCRKGRLKPIRNAVFWNDKISKNRIRDKIVQEELEKRKWKVVILWECQIKKILQKCQTQFLRKIK
ncbi:MAG: very short patch repair endonuclease [Candidatus Omnitrophica bacterium]|nr:very short patch repair endonuclease [Candidatus Omnitrophota bacterium]